MDTTEILDVTAIEPRLKHTAIFEKFDVLNPGNSLVFSNDHDSRPLYYQLLANRGQTFQWKILENGPAIWRIKIKKIIGENEETIGKIVSGDYRKAGVLKKFGIDFSSGGHKTIEQACKEKALSSDDVWQQLIEIDSVSPEKEVNYLSWDIGFLAKYITQIHHRFVSTQTTFVMELAHKVANSNIVRNPEIKEIADLFANVGKTLETKGYKEEEVLFPYIISLSIAYKDGKNIREADFGHISVPICFLQAENEKVIEDFRLIRQLTNGYTAPAYTSSTCPILYKLLAAYEEDTHLHLHLENNILFPKALEMENLMRSKQLITK